MKDRGICCNIGCSNERAYQKRKDDPVPTFRSTCNSCNNAGRGAGPFRIGVVPVKKDYCENQDARLGVECTSTIEGRWQLDVDHIDGNNSNNDPDNLQTLCKNCHAKKSRVKNDHAKGRYTISA